MTSKLRSRDGFTQNASNVWGHCEEPNRVTRQCMWRTLYRCDLCKNFVCADCQKRHLKNAHPERL